LRELRAFVAQFDEADDRRGPAAILERAFRSSALTSAAKKELTALRRNSVVGENLYRALLKVYDQHRLREQTAADVTRSESRVPRVICSEALA
jgi:hypothetical protein